MNSLLDKSVADEKTRLKATYFKYYDKLKPEIAKRAKENWNYNFANQYHNPISLAHAVKNGFSWPKDEEAHWQKIVNGTSECILKN
jgi:hypothetical protein